jgi:hypothetical protein
MAAIEELQEISDKIVAARKKLGADTGDNYFYSTEIQILVRARNAILAENPSVRLAFVHPTPEDLPPPLKRSVETIKEMVKANNARLSIVY